MIKSRAKVDQQANLLLAKVQSDNERRLKGYQLGNLYYQAREYDQAKKYVSQFLMIKDDYAPAHKLLAQIFERSASQEDIKKSINYYKKSYELDESQTQLTLKICALYLKVETTPEQASSVMYWIEKAKMFYPTDPTIFNLQEKMLEQAARLDPGASLDDSLSTMENLLFANLKSQPTEVSVRIKLLKCLEQSQKFDEAIDCISDVLMKSPYYDSFEWYNYTAGLLQSVSKERGELASYLYLLHSFGAARTALMNHPEKVAVEALNRFDQALHSSLNQTGALVSTLLEELKAHQLLLFANSLVKRNADASCISALYVAAYSKTLAADVATGGDDLRELNAITEHLRANRLAQAGYLVLDRCPLADQTTWLRKLSHKFFNRDAKTTLYTTVFGSSRSQTTSMFMADGGLDQIKALMPDEKELITHCSIAQQLYPDSLHYQTWFALRQYENPLEEYMMDLAPRLTFSPARITQCEPESLSQMDLTVFLLHTTYAAHSRLCEHRIGDNGVKVADLSPSLCSEAQSQWWRAVYESSTASHVSASSLKFGRQRQVISRGLQVIRLIDNHGLSAQAVCRVAQLLQAKLEEVKLGLSDENSKVIHLTQWVRQYWTEAVRMLNVVFRNGTLAQPREKLFGNYEENLRPESVKELLAVGRLWLALEMLEEDREDEALDELKELPQPVASYTAAQIYQSKADTFAEDEDGKEVYLLRAQELLRLTMDRLANDIRNPLNVDVERALERVEAELDGQSVSFFSAGETMSHTKALNGSVASTPKQAIGARAMSMRLSSTPRGSPALNVSDVPTGRVRPSPERLELQVRSLATAQESLRATIHEERDMATESNRHMIDSVTQIFDDRLKMMTAEFGKLTERMQAMDESLKEVKAFQQDLGTDIRSIKAKLDSPPIPPPTVTPQPSSSDTQVTFLQQQLAALTAMMATSLQHPSIRPPAHPTSFSGYGTPTRGTPPVFQAGLPENLQLGTYPHLQQQSTTPSRAQPGKPVLTQQEMQAAAVAAAEHGYKDREYYVDDGGDDYYGEDYGNNDYETGYVGAEGYNTIAYMPKTSASGKPMPQPGFFAQPEKTHHKLAEPKPAEPGVPPNVLMDKHMMDKDLAAQKLADVKPSPLVVNVPKNPITTPDPTTPTSVSKGKAVPPSPAKSDTGSVHDSSFDPQFEPIIELPPEVAVITGEEDEKVLYESRAKLFRMDEKEWKERGTGTIKLLERKDTPGKTRLLMRRDHVHKICLNHAIYAELKMVAMGPQGNAWIWSALDHSEPTPVQEQFAIRFKTSEIANEFKKAVDLASQKCGKTEVKVVRKPATGVQVEEATQSSSPTSTNAPLAELFKPADDQWQCDGCYLQHSTSITECPACQRPQPGLPSASGGPSAPAEAASASTSTAISAASPLGFGTFRISGQGSLFGEASAKSTSIFGVASDREITGALAVSSVPSLFEMTSRPATSTFSMFGSKAITSASTGPGLFGVTTSIATTSTGLFEFNTAGLFRSSAPTDTPTSTPTLFTSTNNPISSSGLFGAKAFEGLPPTSSSSLLESGLLTLKPPTTSPDLLGAEPSSTTPSVFGIKAISDTSTTSTSNLSTAKTSTDTPTPVVFGSKGTSAPFSATFAQPSKTIGTNDSADGSLLRSLLSEDVSSSKASTGFNMGGFSFTAPPKVVTSNDSKSEETEKTSKPSVFAGFTGFTTPRSSSAAAFTFSTPSSTASTSKASPFAFTPPTTNLSQGLLSPKSDMKQSSSAPLLGPTEKTPLSNKSKDDLSLISPSKGNAEEECNAEFTPVIALPDLVEVTTGEEGEEQMFVERSKLFRMGDGEWKERGVGELKILRNPQSGAYRLIMRRDQVLKLAANHHLCSGMKITALNEKSRMWAAKDFSEGELKNETLFARFKTAEIAQRFEECFTKAVSSSRSTPTHSGGKSEDRGIPAPAHLEAAPSKSTLAELFKPKGGEWICSGCAVKNKGEVHSCPCCNTSKPGTDDDKSSKEESKAPPPSAGFSSFSFPGFSGADKPSKTAADKPSTLAGTQNTKSSGGFSAFNFSTSLAVTSSSEQAPAAGKPTSPAQAQNSKPGSFTFTGLNLGTAAATPEKGFSTSASTSGPVPQSPGNYVEEDGDGANIHFEPVIDLPDLVDVKTGEEEEEELYVHRAKLYRYSNGEFKEKGLGDVKILQHKDTGKVRIILRREKVLKLACNHLITPDMSLTAMENAGGKTWIWYALDFAESAGTEEMFAIRFKTADIAAEFKTCFDAAKKGEKVPEQKLKSVTPQKSRSRPSSESNTGNRSQTASETQNHATPGKPVTPVKPALPPKLETPVKPATPSKPATPEKPASSGKPTTPAKPAIVTSASDITNVTSLFGNSVVCSPVNPKTPSQVFGTPSNQSAAVNIFGGGSASPSVFGGATATKEKSSPKALFAKMAGQAGDNSSSSSVASSQQIKSRTPVQGGTNKGMSATKLGPASVSTPGKSMIPVADKPVTAPSGTSLLAQAKFSPTSSDSAPSTKTSLGGGLSKQASPLSVGGDTSKNNNSNGAPSGVRSLFASDAGESTSSDTIFGGGHANGKSVGSFSKRLESGQSDVEFVCENRPDETLVRKAKEFLLPNGFYLYEKRKDCRGCIGCEAHEGNLLDHLFYEKPYAKLPGLSLASRSAKLVQTNSKSESAPAEENTFANFTSSVDFSLLSAASNTNAFQKTEGFKWSGAGSTLFGGSSDMAKEDADNPETFDAQTEFKPVIEVLPEVIEVRTGEEDEERIFCNRAKLYKFEPVINEWKERGVGELKLLKHAENGTVRILLRREQVFKLVCNHLIQPSIKLLPMTTSETAWCWFAKDYADTSIEEVPVERIAVRFKNIAIATEFKQKFEESQEFVRQAQESRADLPAVVSKVETPITPSLLEQPTGQVNVEDEEEEVEDDDDDENDDEDDEDSSSDEDEIKVLYERQVTLYERQGSSYQSLGIKMIQVVEENVDIIGGMAVYVLSDDDMDYRQLIFQETPMATVEKKTCSWHMYDFLTERPHLKYLQARFASSAAAKDFSKYITQGIAYAKTMQLKEAEAIHASMATNPIELNLSADGASGLTPK